MPLALLTPHAWGGVVRDDYAVQDYLDFSQNMGQFAIGRPDLSGFSVSGTMGNTTGIYISKTDGSGEGGAIAKMPSWSSFAFLNSGVVAGNGGACLINPQYMGTASHVGVPGTNRYTLTFYRGSSKAFNMTASVGATPDSSGVRWGDADTAVFRLSKIMTEVNYLPQCADVEQLATPGTIAYRTGTGGTWTATNSGLQGLTVGTNPLGGTVKLTALNKQGADWYYVAFSLNRSDTNPLGIGTYSGDSGSPLVVWNAEKGQFEWIGGLSVGTSTAWGNWTRLSYTPERINAFMENTMRNTIDAAAADGVLTWNPDSAESDGSLTQGDAHRWTWQGAAKAGSAGAAKDVFFTGSEGDSPLRIQLAGNIDNGCGSVTFDRGDFIVEAAAGDYSLESAGFIVNKGAHVTTTYTGAQGADWRKVGEGIWTIAGTGDNNVALSVGGGVLRYDEQGNIIRAGEVRLDREGGVAADSVRLSAGVDSVVLMRDGQFNSFSFGIGGGLLNLNGHDLTWSSIDHQDDGAAIGNTSPLGCATPGLATFTFTGSGTYKGSFTDEGSAAGAQLKVLYQGAADSTFTLAGNSDNYGGFEVASGTLRLQGLNTEHANNYRDADDWVYASLQSAQVLVRSGAAFSIGHHALMAGNVVVEDGATFTLNGLVNKTQESLNGGARRDMSAAENRFYSLIGNVELQGSSSAMSATNTNGEVPTYMKGNISGAGSLSKEGAGALVVEGQVRAAGAHAVHAGTLSITDGAGLGGSWTIDAAGALIVRTGISAHDLLTRVTTDSRGVLALTEQTVSGTQLDVSGYSGLLIGAEGRVEYGTRGTSETLLTQQDGAWHLGGGGGDLYVNYLMEGEHTLYIGNDSSAGTVWLTNSANTMSGNIVIQGSGNILKYTNLAALGSARVALTYGNSMELHAADQLPIFSADSAGIVSLSADSDETLDLRGMQLAIGATGDTPVHYSGQLTPDTAGYRFGGNGALVLDTALAGSNDVFIDGQGMSGGRITLNRANSFTGTLRIGGGLQQASVSGTMDVYLGHAEAVSSAAATVLSAGGTLHAEGKTTTIKNLSSVGGALVNDSLANANITLHNTSDTSLAAGTLGGSSATEGQLHITKTGSGTLQLNGNNSNFNGSLTIAEGSVRASVTASTKNALGAATNTIFINEGATLTLNLTKYNGSVGVDANSKTKCDIAQSLSGNGTVQISSGGNVLALGASSGFTGDIEVINNTRFYVTGGNAAGTNNATIVITDGSQARVTNQIKLTSTARITSAADYVISGNGFGNGNLSAGEGFSYQLVSDGFTGGALSVDCGSTITGNVTLAADASIASWAQVNSSSNKGYMGYGAAGCLGGTIRGNIYGEGKTLTLVGNQTLSFNASAASTYGALVLNGGALELRGGTAQSQHSTALGLGSVTINANKSLRFLGSGSADSAVIYHYDNSFRAAEGAQITAANNTLRLTGQIAMTGASLRLGSSDSGVLRLEGGIAGSGTVTVADGSELVLGASSLTGTLAMGSGSALTLLDAAASDSALALSYSDSLSLALQGDGVYQFSSLSGSGDAASLSLNFDFRSGYSGSALQLGSADGLTAADSTISVTLNEAGRLVAGRYTLIGNDVSGCSFALAEGSDSRLSLQTGTNGILQLVVAGDTRQFWQHNDSSTEWNSAHWQKDGSDTPLAYDSANTAVLDALGVAEGNSAENRERISFAQTVETNGAVILSGACYYSFEGAGALQGTSLSIVDGADLSLVNSGNRFSEGVSVSHGHLALNSSAALSGTTVNVGGSDALLSLAVAGAMQGGSVSLAAGGTAALSTPDALAGGATVTFDGGTLRYAADNIEGASAALRAGTGAVMLDLNGHCGIHLDDSTSLAAATLELRDSSGSAGNSLRLGSDERAFTLNGATLFIDGGLSAEHHTAGANSATIWGSGDYRLCQQSGTMTLGAGSDYSGTIIKEGAAALTINTPGLAGSLDLRGGTTTLSGVFSSIRNIDVSGENTTLLLFNDSSINGSATRIRLRDHALLQLDNGATWHNVTANINIEGSARMAGSYNGSYLVVAGSVSGHGLLSLTQTPGRTNRWTISGAISDDATGALALTVDSNLTLSGNNSYSGGTTITGGTLITSGSNALGSGSVTVQSGGALQSNVDLSISGLKGSGSVNMQNHALKLVGADDATFSGTLQGVSALSKSNSSTQKLADLQAGDLRVQEGRLELGHAALSGSVQIDAGSTLSITDNAALTGQVTNEGTLQLNGSIDTVATILNSGSIALGEDIRFNLHSQLQSTTGFTLLYGGSISYAHELGTADFLLDGVAMTDMRAGRLSITQSAAALHVLLGAEANLTWNGTDGNWDKSREQWLMPGEDDQPLATRFYDGDSVCFAAGGSRDVSVNSDVFVTNFMVTESDYRFSGSGSIAAAGAVFIAGQNITLATALEAPALSVSSGASATAALPALHVDRLDLGGSLRLTQVSGALSFDLDATQGGTLALDLSGNTSYNSGALKADTLVLSGSGKSFTTNLDGIELKRTEVGAGVTLAIRNQSADSGEGKSLGTVSLGQGAVFQIYDAQQPSSFTDIGTLELAGTGASFADTYNSGYNRFGSLQLAEGITSATLVFNKGASSSVVSVYELGTPEGDVGNFAGTIQLNITNNSGNARPAALVIANGEITKNAVIDLNSSASSAAASKLYLGLKADNVTIAGLKSGTSKAEVFAGSVAAQATSITAADSARTLVIDTAAESDYSYSGAIGANVNLTKTGAGTQRLLGSSGAFNGSISIQEGSLNVNAASASMLGSASSVSIADGAVLALSGIDFSAGIALGERSSLSFSSGALLNLGTELTADTTYTVFSGATVENLHGWDSLSARNLMFNGSLMGRAELSFGNGTIIIGALNRADLVWNGGSSGTWDSSSSNWDWNGSNTAFVHTDNVRFNSDADMTLAENLQANTLTVDEGRRLNLSGDGTVLTVNSLDGTGSTALGEGVTLALSGTRSGAINLSTLSGDGTLRLALADTGTNTLNLGSFAGTTRLTSGVATLGNGTLSSSLALEGAAQVNIAGGSSVRVEGVASAKDYSATVNDATKDGAWVVASGAKLTFAKSGSQMAELRLSGATATFSKAADEASASYTVDKQIKMFASGNTLNVENGVTLHTASLHNGWGLTMDVNGVLNIRDTLNVSAATTLKGGGAVEVGSYIGGDTLTMDGQSSLTLTIRERLNSNGTLRGTRGRIVLDTGSGTSNSIGTLGLAFSSGSLTLQVNEGSALTVTNALNMSASSKVILQQKASLTRGSITLTGLDSNSTASITKTGANASYAATDSNFTVTKTRLSSTAADGRISNKLVQAEVENAGGGTLSVDLSASGADALAGVYATAGDIRLLTNTATELHTLVSEGAYTLSVRDGNGAVGSLRVGGELRLAEGTSLETNLEIASGVRLTLGGSAELNGNSLTLGNAIRISDNMLVGLATNGSFTLATGVGSLVFQELSALAIAVDADSPVGYSETVSSGDWDASAYFANLDGNTRLSYHNGTLSLMSVPEPATATLSLLALSALCLRRRRRA